MVPPIPADVARILATYPAAACEYVAQIRTIIFDVSAGDPCIGPLTETLKWGEPAYLTERTKSGSTIRLAWKASTPAHVRLLFNCNTSLVESFRERFDGVLEFEKNRALLVDVASPLPAEEIEFCVTQALTYHRDKRRRVEV